MAEEKKQGYIVEFRGGQCGSYGSSRYNPAMDKEEAERIKDALTDELGVRDARLEPFDADFVKDN